MRPPKLHDSPAIKGPVSSAPTFAPWLKTVPRLSWGPQDLEGLAAVTPSSLARSLQRDPEGKQLVLESPIKYEIFPVRAINMPRAPGQNLSQRVKNNNK